MSRKILDTFVRVSTTTRDKLRAYCWKHNLEQGRFADAAILFAIGAAPSTANLAKPSNGPLAKRKKAAE